MKSKYNKSIGDHNISSGNELGSHNFNQVKFPEVASAIIACAAVGIVLSALVWLVVRHGNEVGMAVVVLAVLVFVSIVVLGSVIVTCVVIKQVSSTKAQLLYDAAQPFRNNILETTPTSMALYNPRTDEYRVENAQQVSIAHHHAAPQIGSTEWPLPKKTNDMPSMYDLTYMSDAGER